LAADPSRTTDELATAIRSLVDKALQARTREQIAARGRELATAIAGSAGGAAESASVMAGEAWRDSAPQRKEAAKSARKMSRKALAWSRGTWNRRVGPAVRDAWDGRAAALAAAGVAVPTSRELAKQAQKRLRLQRHEERRWRTFFLGVILGAIGGAIVALLTAPRPGREVRDELAHRADEFAHRAREAANNASEWAPLFQRPPEADLQSTVRETAEAATPPVERKARTGGNGAPAGDPSGISQDPGEPI
jgi:gas vesicle protein